MHSCMQVAHGLLEFAACFMLNQAHTTPQIGLEQLLAAYKLPVSKVNAGKHMFRLLDHCAWLVEAG